jgi:hypothetical protein
LKTIDGHRKSGLIDLQSFLIRLNGGDSGDQVLGLGRHVGDGVFHSRRRLGAGTGHGVEWVGRVIAAVVVCGSGYQNDMAQRNWLQCTGRLPQAVRPRFSSCLSSYSFITALYGRPSTR